MMRRRKDDGNSKRNNGERESRDAKIENVHSMVRNWDSQSNSISPTSKGKLAEVSVIRGYFYSAKGDSYQHDRSTQF